MKKSFANFFKLSNWKRWLIVSITLLLALFSMIFAGTFYLGNNINPSNDFGGGTEVVVRVDDPSTNQVASESQVETVAQNIFDRLGGTSTQGLNVTNQGNGFIRITRTNTNNSNENNLNELVNQILDKPSIVFTNTNGTSLFTNNGSFNASLNTPGFNNPVNSNSNFSSLIPPFKSNSAKFENGTITIDLTSNGEKAWAAATQYISRQTDTSNPELNQRIAMWLNLKQLIDDNQGSVGWSNANENPYNFVFNNENPTGANASLKTSPFNARNFLISNQAITSEASNATSITINGTFTQAEAERIVADINFATNDSVSLQKISSNVISPTFKNSSLSTILIATLVIIALIAIFMIFNYGVLGLLTTFATAFFAFLTLLVFTSLNGEYSGGTIAGLIIGIGIVLNTSIVIFERLKLEVYRGDGLQKASFKSFKISWFSIFDTQIILLLMAILTFFVGPPISKSISIIMLIAFGFILFSTLVFTRIISTLMIRSHFFDKRLLLLGIRKKYVDQEQYVSHLEKINYLKISKWFSISLIIFILAGLITYATLSGLLQSSSGGLNANINFSGGSTFVVQSGINGLPISLDQANRVENVFRSINSDFSSITINNVGTSFQPNYIIIASSITPFSAEMFNNIQNSIQVGVNNIFGVVGNNVPNIPVNSFTFSIQKAIEELSFVIYAVIGGLASIFLYVSLRYRWTLAFALIVTLIQDSLIVFSIFVIFRIEFSNIFIIVWLAVLFYSLNDKMNLITKYKEISSLYSREKQTKDVVYNITNTTTGLMSKKLIVSFVNILIIFVVFSAFINATSLSFNIGILFGVFSSLFSSIFTQMWLICKLEIQRHKRQEKRIKKSYWNTDFVSEQTFVGINNFEP